jgi:SAM-dependent methyltransferase
MNIWATLAKYFKCQGTVRALLAYFLDWFDLKYGTNTTRRVQLPDLDDIEGENKQRGVNYVPTKMGPFIKVMDALHFPPGSVFVDLGCGKGRPLLLASGYPFQRIVGVEFSHRLCEEARKNWSTYQRKRGVRAEVEIIEADVVDYELKDDENVFYMFNPFDAEVVGKILKNIGSSIERRKRTIWLIYNNPKWHDAVIESGLFVRTGAFSFPTTQYGVYTTREEVTVHPKTGRFLRENCISLQSRVRLGGPGAIT